MILVYIILRCLLRLIGLRACHAQRLLARDGCWHAAEIGVSRKQVTNKQQKFELRAT